MKQWRSALVALAAIAAAAAPAVADAPGGMVAGLWVNPHRSVVVRVGGCGGKLCGWVVWANPEARQDARDGGVPDLIGTELLQDYSLKGGSWAGTIFVPDMGRHFSSTIAVVNPNQLKVKGCLIGGFICKAQSWQRIAHAPGA